MKVIMAGFSKTGTKSMDAALRTLGYKVYGYTENIFRLEKEWTKIFHEGGTIEDFRRMYENIDAVSDVPACNFWEEILMAFPEAKIILMRRESEDEWFESLRNQIHKLHKSFIIRMVRTMSPTMWRIEKNVGVPTGRLAFGYTSPPIWSNNIKINKELAKKRYRAHNAHVLQNAPKDQLLLYNVSEGWEPLCEFLGVPVPDVPFPHKNVRGNIDQEWLEFDPVLIRMQREMYATLSISAVILSYATYKLIKHPPTEAVMTAFDWLKTTVLRYFER